MEASTNAVTLIAIATIVSGVNKSAKPVFSEKRPDERVIFRNDFAFSGKPLIFSTR